MPCQPVRFPGGAGIICGVRERRTRCQMPGCDGWTVALCDYPRGKGTCDFKMCQRHRTSVGADRDHCPGHASADDVREPHGLLTL